MRGKIARITKDKGFGFIRSDNKDYFFHRSGCISHFDLLKEHDEVTFEQEESPKGPRAAYVEKL